MTQNDYQIADQACLTALASLQASTDVTVWLSSYSQLFDSVTYSVGDLPLLPDCNFEGQHFEHISKFCSIYETLLNDIQIASL